MDFRDVVLGIVVVVLVLLLFSSPNSDSGWVEFVDTEYVNESSGFLVAAGVNSSVPNNAGVIRAGYKPEKLRSVYDWYNGSKLLALDEGDAICLTVEFDAVPQSPNGFLDLWLDIGDNITGLYPRELTFPKGAGITRSLSFTSCQFQLDTWVRNGAILYVTSDIDVIIHSIRYIPFLIHDAS